MAQDPGESFYDGGDVHARYTRHRGIARHLSANAVMETPAVLAAVGDPRGLRILELGCGDGGFGRDLLGAGAAGYEGIDNSARMVEQARRALTRTAGRVRVGRIEDEHPAPASVDLVVARLSLHYVADLRSVIEAMTNGLTRGGRLIFTVVHPVITSHDHHSAGPRTDWTVDEYFDRGPRSREWLGATVTWYHRTISDYVGAVIGAGLRLESVDECEPDADLFDGHTDELERRRRVPLFLLLRGRKPAPRQDGEEPIG